MRYYFLNPVWTVTLFDTPKQLEQISLIKDTKFNVTYDCNLLLTIRRGENNAKNIKSFGLFAYINSTIS